MNIHLNDYCERLGIAGMAAEPLNAISNIAFMAAAIIAFKAFRNLPPEQHSFKNHIDIYALCLILMLIGFGSGAWHLHPTDSTLMMDIIPISIFINLYLVSLLRRKFHMRWGYIAFIFALQYKANHIANTSFDASTLNGTILYLPTWLMLVAICCYGACLRAPFAKELINVSALWSLSLLFRTIDFATCSILPIGTHFIWHLLNAIVLYRLLKILIAPKLFYTNTKR